MNPEEKNSQLFMSLVYSFQMQAMIQMGKIKNPMTETIEKDLNAAQVTIDMMDMLKAKTKNNLGEQESKFIEQASAELKLNFVNEKAKDGSPAGEEGNKDEENTGNSETGQSTETK